MKRSYLGVISLLAVLFMNIVFTQLLVHQFFYQNFGDVLLYMSFNLLLFPLAVLIYRKEVNKGGSKNAK
ncbi:hypothetical protein ACFO3D_15310 [Virgibacillus kekensis]|uniref:Uncharacterized protein n=1 Tax=Virgibacillus kekensis TaxID=202261 RepID=A0ABV9DL36_9BACI